MTTPFDGKLNWWHYRADSVAFDTRADFGAEVGKRTPAAAGVIVKVAHGHTWEGPKGSDSPIAIHGPDDVALWAGKLAAYDLDLHIWATPVGADPQREAMVVAQAANAPGVKSVILDVEPYAGFWQGDAAAAEQYMTTLLSSVSADLHIGLSLDSRNVGKLKAIQFGVWTSWGIKSLHPQVVLARLRAALRHCAARMHRNAGRLRAAHLPGAGHVPESAHGRCRATGATDRCARHHEAGNGRGVTIPPRRRQLDAGHLRRYQQGLGERLNKWRRSNGASWCVLLCTSRWPVTIRKDTETLRKLLLKSGRFRKAARQHNGN